MERLWSPWRMQYIDSAGENQGGCIFCDQLAEGNDEKTHILYRGPNTFVILNTFPYNSGHVMVAPLRHEGELAGLSDAERDELMAVTSLSIQIIGESMSPHGFNVGMNLGQVAGAGIPGHVHMHIVPRWGGDTNFMPIVAETKVLPEMLSDTDAKLRPGFARHERP